MFEDFRKKVFLFIEPSKYTGYVTPYNVFMGVIIFISVLPIMVKHDSSWLIWIDLVSTVIFVIDYILRWLTADIKFKEPGAKSFLRYPLQRMAVIDLISIIPGFFYINGFHLHRIFRVLRTFRFLRIIRYSKSTSLIIRALKNQKNSLYAVVIMAVEYVFVCALIIFNVEPQTFHTFFDAVYWSTVSLTTVGYGDIYPVSTAGQIMAMLSSFLGIAVIAMPAGLITAGIIQEMENQYSKEEKAKAEKAKAEKAKAEEAKAEEAANEKKQAAAKKKKKKAPDDNPKASC